MTEETSDNGARAEDSAENTAPAENDAGQGPEPVDELEQLRQQAADSWNNYLRVVAEMDNLRKRNARELETARRYGVERFVAAILPVRDSLEAGLKAVQDADAAAVDLVSLLEGEQATLRLLDQAFESAGITVIDPEGEPFDPEKHEAMSMLPSATAEPNSIIAVVQKGYQLHERVVRPARVVVARAASEPETD